MSSSFNNNNNAQVAATSSSSSNNAFSPKGVKRSGRSSSPVRNKTTSLQANANNDDNIPLTKMDWIQVNVSVYVAVVAAITAAMLMIPSFCDSRRFLAIVLPYVLIVSFLFLLAFYATYLVYIVVSRGWAKLFQDKTFDLVKWIWSELKQLGNFFAAKFVISMLLGLLSIFSFIWLKHHLDLLYVLTTIKQFLATVWEYFFDIPKLIKGLRNWIIETKLKLVIVLLATFIDTSQAYIADHAVGGLIFIGAFAGITVAALLVAKNWIRAIDFLKSMFTTEDPNAVRMPPFPAPVQNAQ